MISVAASFLSVWNQCLIDPVGDESAFEGCGWRNVARRNTRDSDANVEPAQHNQITLLQLNNEVVNLTGLLKTKD